MTTTLSNEDRSGAICEAGDADLHFADEEELIADYGYTEDQAKAFVAEAEADAKALCAVCPIRRQCLNFAMANDEEWGVWGGMNRAERLLYRSAWASIKKSQGHEIRPTVQKDYDALHINPGVNGRYHRRLAWARQCLDRLMELPADWTLDTGQVGTHGRDRFVQIYDLCVRYPERTNEELAAGLDRSATWFTVLFSRGRQALKVE